MRSLCKDRAVSVCGCFECCAASFPETGWLMDEREGDGDKLDIHV